MALNLDMNLLESDNTIIQKNIEIVDVFMKMIVPGKKLKVDNIQIENLRDCIKIISGMEKSAVETTKMIHKLYDLTSEPIPSIEFI